MKKEQRNSYEERVGRILMNRTVNDYSELID